MSAKGARLALAVLLAAATSRGLDIQFTLDPDNLPDAQALAGFESAAQIWESLLHDDVNVYVQIGMRNFGASQANIIGQAGSTFYSGSYTELRTALAADATSAADASVLASLPTGQTYSRRINYTFDTPGLPSQPWINTTDGIQINGGNARALGLLPNSYLALDAQIEFNTAFAFDYNRADGIQANQMDFIGVALHELGHALGFTSAADNIDAYWSQGITTTYQVGADNYSDFLSMPMDLLRYSTASLELGITDVTVGPGSRFLLINGTQLSMSTGVSLGNGQQASHYLESIAQASGLMDPTADYGEILNISANDLLVMDAIGWNLTAVPEPSTYGLVLGGLALAAASLRRRKSA